MKTKIVLTLSILLGSIIAQAEMNYSYEMKYGDGNQVTGSASDNSITSDYNYFENLLDINTYYGENMYIYSQLEYSNRPVFGSRANGLNTFYLEYQDDQFKIILGDQYELYGRGLSFYTLQDQNIDYNNSLKGITLNYFLMQNIEISSLIGKRSYSYRSNPSFRETDLQLETSVIFNSVNYENNKFGYFQYAYTKQQLAIDPALTGIFEDKTEIFYELNNRLETDQELIEIYLSYQSESILDTVDINNHNFNWNLFLGPFDIYVDKAWLQYDKIFGNEVFGSRFYTSIFTELFDAGITYEYKNYYTPYLIKSISNPPICYRIGNSILASRNTHSMNFGNEIGHQIDLNRNLFGIMNLAANLSLSHRHKSGDMASISLFDVLSMKDENKMYDYYPFRQMYLEINGWALSERLYYKAGMDHYIEIYGGKNTSALTFPTHWAWKLSNGSSFTIYMEAQEKIEKQRDLSDFTLDKETKYLNYYSSLSYNHMGKWVVTSFYDQETKNSKSNKWVGADLSYKINSETQVSLFYGSQKGGLVCANGICAEQPGFEYGYKIILRSLF